MTDIIEQPPAPGGKIVPERAFKPVRIAVLSFGSVEGIS